MAFGGPRSSYVRPGAHSARHQDSHNDLTPYRMAEPFVSAGAHTPHSDETLGPTATATATATATRGSSRLSVVASCTRTAFRWWVRFDGDSDDMGTIRVPPARSDQCARIPDTASPSASASRTRCDGTCSSVPYGFRKSGKLKPFW